MRDMGCGIWANQGAAGRIEPQAEGDMAEGVTLVMAAPRYPPSRHKKHERAVPAATEYRPSRDPWRRSDAERRSDAQYKLHREAPAEAVDPETANCKRNASTQEGGLCRVPACTTQTVKLSLDAMIRSYLLQDVSSYLPWFLVIPPLELTMSRGGRRSSHHPSVLPGCTRLAETVTTPRLSRPAKGS